MITRTEDNFDVDYDLFSLAGRAALIGGGIYALDKSIKQDVFKKGSTGLGTFNNKYVKDLSDIIRSDPEMEIRDVKNKDTPLKESTFFKQKKVKEDLFRVHSATSMFQIPGQAKKTSLKDLMTGGYQGMSADFIDELSDVQAQIKLWDKSDLYKNKKAPYGNNIPSGSIELKFGKNKELIGVNISSKAGMVHVPLVGKDGMMTLGSSRHATRALHTKAADGYTKSASYGVDVGILKHLKENYQNYLSGDMSLKELNSRLHEAIVYDSKEVGISSSARTNPLANKNIINSSMPDPFSTSMSKQTIEKIARHEAVYGAGVGGASDAAAGIVYLEDNVVKNTPGLAYTSNPNQLTRSNVSYTDLNGNKGFTSHVNTMFMDEKQLDTFRQVASEMGFDFGELAKEELLGNQAILGRTTDTTRSRSIDANKMTDLSEFLLEKMRAITGLSLDEFSDVIENFGFEGFSSDISEKLRAVGVDDYQSHIKSQLDQALTKRNSLLKANSVSPEMLGTRRELLAQRDAFLRVTRNKGAPNFPTKNSKALRKYNKDVDYYREAQDLNKRGILKAKLESINSQLKTIRKVVNPKDLKNPDFQKAMNLKRDPAMFQRTLASNEAHIESLNKKMAFANVLGLSPDHSEMTTLEQAHRGAFINNLSKSNGSLTFSLRVEKYVSQGFKIVDPSGENKAVVKDTFMKMREALIETHIRMGGDMSPAALAKYDNVHFIANASAMKNDFTARAAYSTLDSIKTKAKVEGNQAILGLFDNFDKSKKTDEDFRSLVRSIDTMAPGESLNKLIGDDTVAGFVKSKLIAHGASASELGAGKLGFFAERHIQMMAALPLKNFAKDIMKRRTNPGQKRLFQDVENAQAIMKDSTNAGFIDFNKLDDNFMRNVFPKAEESTELFSNVFKNRAKFLEPYSKNGIAYISLGEEILGYNKIAIYGDERFKGYIGEATGSKGDYKKYTELDTYTRDIIFHLKSGSKDKGKLEQLVRNYDVAQKQMQQSIMDKILKGKVTKSMAGQIASGSAELLEYASNLSKMHGKETVNALPFVAAVSEKQFKQMFGKKAYDDFVKTKISNSWAFGVREPAEGLSGIPFNVVPANHIKGIKNLNDERMAVVTGVKNNILSMVFGDTDGDMMSLVAARTNLSQEEIKELAIGNSRAAIAYRQSQEYKTMFSLKGKKAGSILEGTMAEIRLSSYLSKTLEKDFVGIASTRLEPLHEMNRRMFSEKSPKIFANNETLLHTLAENIIKGKHQTSDDLLTEKAKKILDSITNGDSFAQGSSDEKVKIFRDFVDELILGDAKQFAERLRSGEKSQELINEIATSLAGKIDDPKYKEAHVLAVNRAKELVESGVHKTLTDDDAIKNIMVLSDIINPKEFGIDAALDFTSKAEVRSANAMRMLAQAEEIQEGFKNSKKALHGLGGNLFKYAALPAAALGLLGTVFGARSSIESDVEFSDNMNNHNKSNSGSFTPFKSQNMKSPKHMKPEILAKGQRGFSATQYAATHQSSDVRISDSSKSFDYFDMRDKVNRGY